jgi:hypothetical protein
LMETLVLLPIVTRAAGRRWGSAGISSFCSTANADHRLRQACAENAGQASGRRPLGA